jgi:hypothetical protein
MGRDRIRYLVYTYGRWRWRPTKAMRARGFQQIILSEGIVVNGKNYPSAEAAAAALRLNADWDRVRRGQVELAVEQQRYPRGSVGEAFLRCMAARESERARKGIVWTSEHRSRDDWARSWRWLEPLFADCDPKTIKPEQFVGAPGQPGLCDFITQKVSAGECYRVVKTWRAFWKKMAIIGYCDAKRDPSLFFRNSAPTPRQATWTEGEATRLVKAAWRAGFKGLAACLATAWDSQLSPVDVRRLAAQDMRQDDLGIWFDLARAKTGRAAIATLSPRSTVLVLSYLDQQPAEAFGPSPIFRNRSGTAYSKDTLSDDFADVRAMVFGPGETRWLSDFRRSGAVEAVTGRVAPSALSHKMANTISQSNRLFATYAPARLASVRQADEARRAGRTILREQRPTKSIRSPDQKYQNDDQKKAKPLK